ncbi:unnamed protein product [Closterium sp. NIES-53]
MLYGQPADSQRVCDGGGVLSRGRQQLWEEKVGLKVPFAGNAAMDWGQEKEGGALMAYERIIGGKVELKSFQVWLCVGYTLSIITTTFNSYTLSIITTTFNSNTLSIITTTFNSYTLSIITTTFNSYMLSIITTTFNSYTLSIITTTLNSYTLSIITTTFNSYTLSIITTTFNSLTLSIITTTFNSYTLSIITTTFNSYMLSIITTTFNSYMLSIITTTFNSYTLPVPLPLISLPLPLISLPLPLPLSPPLPPIRSTSTKTRPAFSWLGASPDGLLPSDRLCFHSSPQSPGVLEIKCPFNRGSPLSATPYPSIPVYYMPQIQGLLEIFDRDWLDFFVWTEMGGTALFRVERDKQYWELLFTALEEFWRVYVVPAKEALREGQMEEEVRWKYYPVPEHVLMREMELRSEQLSKGSRMHYRASRRVLY